MWKSSAIATPTSQKGSQLFIHPSDWLAHAKKDAWVPKIEPGTVDAIRVPPSPESLNGIVPWDELREADRMGA